MKKRLASLSLALILALGLFAGCNSSSTSTPAPASTPSTADGGATNTDQDPVTLSWVLWDLNDAEYYKMLGDAYTAANPHVTIEYTDIASADYMNMVQTQLAGGSDFDVVTIKDVPGYVNLINQDRLEPLNSYVEAAGINLSAFNGIVEQVTAADGNYYELPFISSYWVLYYNKDLFDAANVEYPSNDLTMEEFDALIREVTQGEGNDKVYGNHYHTWRSCVQLFSVLDGKNTLIDGNYDFLAPYYEQILAQQADDVVMSYATATSTSSHYRDLFYNESTAMVNNGTWLISTLLTAIAEGETDIQNWGMVKYPHPEGVKAGTTLGQITGLAINKDSKNKEAAFDFINFVSGAEGASIVASTGAFPAQLTDDALDQISSLPGFPQDENSIAALRTETIYLEMPMHEKSSDIEDVLNEEHAEIMNGSKSIEDGIASMNSRVAEILG